MKYIIKILISLIFIISFLNVSAMSSGTTSSGTIIKEDPFKLDSVKVIYDNELLLNFNHKLANIEGLLADLKINELNNKFNTSQVDNTTISGSTINIKLKTTLNASTDYEITVINNVFDVNGSNITQGVNASKTFKTPAIFDIPKPTITTSNSGIELNSAADINLNNILKDAIPTKQPTPTVEANNITNNTFDTAQNNKKLPTTGPAEWLLLAISLFFGLIYFTFKTKYKN